MRQPALLAAWMLSLLSGILLAMPWYDCVPGCLIFVALLPLLSAERIVIASKGGIPPSSFYAMTYVCFLAWNVGAAWWLVYSSLRVAVVSLLFNALVMALPLMLWHRVRAAGWGLPCAYAWLVPLWLCWEWVQLHADISLPWLLLGNAFAHDVTLVQWFEFTGVLGGSLWVLTVNVLLSRLTWLAVGVSRVSLARVAALVAALLFPAILSLHMYEGENAAAAGAEVLIVQPNVDCFGQKFSLPPLQQVRSMVAMGRAARPAPPALVIFPETAVTAEVNEDSLQGNVLLQAFAPLRGCRVISGCLTSRRVGGEMLHYNSLVCIAPGSRTMVYHKQKLLPGVEFLPLFSRAALARELLLDVGNTSVGFDSSPRDRAFDLGDLCVQPRVCYESAFGRRLAANDCRGPGFIVIATNDGWWGNTPGHRQHLNLARLRAVENRRHVARCANTGVSCIINARGDVVQSTMYGVATCLRATVGISSAVTFYAAWGDWLGWLAAAWLLLSFSFIALKGNVRR